MNISDELVKAHRKAHKIRCNGKHCEPIQTEINDFWNEKNQLTLNQFISVDKIIKGD